MKHLISSEQRIFTFFGFSHKNIDFSKDSGLTITKGLTKLNTFDLKSCLVFDTKNIGTKISSKKFLVEKNIGPRNYFVPKKFQTQNSFIGPKLHNLIL